MEKLKQYQEILKLGKTLVAEFSDNERNDLTTAWMAHYLSEIITEAEGETIIEKKRKLQGECCEVIMTLWEKRVRFPNKNIPLSGLAEGIIILKSLKDEKNTLSWNRYIDHEISSAWGEYIKQTRKMTEAILALCLSGGVTENMLDNEKRWLENEGLLSDEEKTMIRMLDEFLNKSYVGNQFLSNDEINNLKKQQPDRTELIIDKLNEINSSMLLKLQDLENKVIKNK